MKGLEAKDLQSFIFGKSLASRKTRKGVQLDLAGEEGTLHAMGQGGQQQPLACMLSKAGDVSLCP